MRDVWPDEAVGSGVNAGLTRRPADMRRSGPDATGDAAGVDERPMAVRRASSILATSSACRGPSERSIRVCSIATRFVDAA
jgi:hypothetical protein